MTIRSDTLNVLFAAGVGNENVASGGASGDTELGRYIAERTAALEVNNKPARVAHM